MFSSQVRAFVSIVAAVIVTVALFSLFAAADNPAPVQHAAVVQPIVAPAVVAPQPDKQCCPNGKCCPNGRCCPYGGCQKKIDVTVHKTMPHKLIDIHETVEVSKACSRCHGHCCPAAKREVAVEVTKDVKVNEGCCPPATVRRALLPWRS